MLNLIEREGPTNPNLNGRYLPDSIQSLLPTGEFDPFEKRIVYLRAQGMDPLAIGRVLGLTPEQLADHQANINKKFAEDERAATSLSFMALFNSIRSSNDNSKGFNLSLREEQVFSMFAAGYTSSEMGDKLYISSKTADKHRARIIEELGARNRVEAVFIVLSALSPDERNRFFPSVKKIALCESLTEREKEILALFVQGKTSREIAAHFKISPKTADNHKANIKEKLGTNNIVLTATVALTGGLVSIQS